MEVPAPGPGRGSPWGAPTAPCQLRHNPQGHGTALRHHGESAELPEQGRRPAGIFLAKLEVKQRWELGRMQEAPASPAAAAPLPASPIPPSLSQVFLESDVPGTTVLCPALVSPLTHDSFNLVKLAPSRTLQAAWHTPSSLRHAAQRQCKPCPCIGRREKKKENQ